MALCLDRHIKQSYPGMLFGQIFAGYPEDSQKQPQPCPTCKKAQVSSAYLLSNMTWGASAQKIKINENNL